MTDLLFLIVHFQLEKHLPMMYEALLAIIFNLRGQLHTVIVKCTISALSRLITFLVPKNHIFFVMTTMDFF